MQESEALPLQISDYVSGDLGRELAERWGAKQADIVNSLTAPRGLFGMAYLV